MNSRFSPLRQSRSPFPAHQMYGETLIDRLLQIAVAHKFARLLEALNRADERSYRLRHGWQPNGVHIKSWGDLGLGRKIGAEFSGGQLQF
jgi:hypothetical protein